MPLRIPSHWRWNYVVRLPQGCPTMNLIFTNLHQVKSVNKQFQWGKLQRSQDHGQFQITIEVNPDSDTTLFFAPQQSRHLSSKFKGNRIWNGAPTLGEPLPNILFVFLYKHIFKLKQSNYGPLVSFQMICRLMRAWNCYPNWHDVNRLW